MHINLCSVEARDTLKISATSMKFISSVIVFTLMKMSIFLRSCDDDESTIQSEERQVAPCHFPIVHQLIVLCMYGSNDYIMTIYTNVNNIICISE